MGADESGTLRRWMSALQHVLQPAAERHRGTIVKTMGDGVLVEFPSVFDAVEWAEEVQRVLRTPDPTAVAGESPLSMRVAVHVGDVMVTPGDIYGDGVNVAARLLEHADPGSIVISEVAYALLRGAVGSRARDLGFLSLKNIEHPVRAFSLDADTIAAPAPMRIASAMLPSIAVLPLQNLGGDASDDYFADGIVEDIIVSLGGLKELLVISRGSTLMYRGRLADPREVARTLGVRYVLAGSVRRSARQIRVAVHLSHADSGTSLWSERLEVSPDELFDAQDRIVNSIVSGIAPSVRSAELVGAMRRRPESFSAYDCTLKALDILHQLKAETFVEARQLLERAMAEDPKFAMPAAWAARWHSINVGQGWSTDPGGDAARAVEFASRAIELDRKNALALATYGHLKSFLSHDSATALIYLDRAIECAPNCALAWLLRSGTLSYVGDGAGAVQHAEHALRLSPFDHDSVYFYTFLNLAHYADGGFANAVKWGRMATSINASYTANLRLLAAAHAGAGELEEARAIARRLMTLEPKFSLSAYAATRQPFRHAALAERYMAHLRQAELPD